MSICPRVDSDGSAGREGMTSVLLWLWFLCLPVMVDLPLCWQWSVPDDVVVSSGSRNRCWLFHPRLGWPWVCGGCLVPCLTSLLLLSSVVVRGVEVDCYDSKCDDG